MNNKSRLKTILLIICLVLVLILLLLTVSLYKIITKDQNKKNKVQKNSVISEKFDVQEIEELSFNFRNSKVEYIISNEDYLTIKQTGKTNKFLLKQVDKDETLLFKEQVTNVFTKTSYKIYIPESFFGRINITNGFGDVAIDNFVNELVIDNNSGNINIGNINNAEIKNVSGNININSIDTFLTASSSIGDISVLSLKGNANIDTITGDISINDFIILGDTKIESTSGDISIKMNKESKCKLKVKTEGEINNISKNVCRYNKNILKINNVTGVVTIK